MARLPNPGSDNGTWGDILNEYLSQSLKSDGSIKDNAVTSSSLAPNSVTNEALASNAVNATTIANGSITEVLLDATLQAKVNATAPVTSVSGKTGVVTLDKSDVGLANVDNTSDAAKNAAIATLTNKTLTDPKINYIYDTNGNAATQIGGEANAENYIWLRNSAAGDQVQVRAGGSDANVSLGLTSKGTGYISLANSLSTSIARFMPVTNPVNYWTFSQSATGQSISASASGTDTNIGINLIPKGAGAVQANGVEVVTLSGTQTLTNKTLTNPRINSLRDTANGTIALATGAAASAVNYLYAYGDSTGASPQLAVFGSDTDIDLMLVPKGSGKLRLYATTGNTPTLAGSGQDANHDLALAPKGAGFVRLEGSGALLPMNTVLSFYNTADQTMNYERARQYWTGNVYTIASEASGTGTPRVIEMKSNTVTFRMRPSGSTSGLWEFASGLGSVGTVGLNISGNYNASSGVNAVSAIQPTIAQTGTAGYTALLVNPTENTTGSGAKLLADFQLGGISKAKIYPTGDMSLGNLQINQTISGNSLNSGITFSGTARSGANGGSGFSFILGYNTLGNKQIWFGDPDGYGLPDYTFVRMTGSGVLDAISGDGNERKRIALGVSTDDYSGATLGGRIFATYAVGGHTSGTVKPFLIQPTINDSGTAGYTALTINPTETATGSGTKLLADFQVGGTSKASIDTTGVITAAAGTASGNVVTTDGTQTLTNKTLTSPQFTGKLNLSGAAGTSGDVNMGSAGVYSYNSTSRYIRFNSNGSYNDFLSAGSKLVINYGAAIDPQDVTFFENTKASFNPYVYLYGYDAGALTSKYGRMNIGTDGKFQIEAQSGEDLGVITGGSERITVLTGGNVGIGMTPAVKLDVSGEIRASTAGSNSTSVVTVGGTQTLTNKTMSGSSNTFSNIPQSAVTNLATDISSKVSTTSAPIQFAAATALVGLSPTDRAYANRTLTGARMRTASAPAGSDLVVQVQHFDGSSWTTIGTLTIANGSTVESEATFSQAQTVGNLLRMNVTSIGSMTAATGVVVDVLWS